MSLKDFKVLKVLGKGAFGRVDLVERKEDGKIYAMKCVKISQLNTKEQENALNEVRVLASISHPNIIGYKEAFFDEESKTLNIVMEYADDGDLETKIQSHTKNKTNFPENEIWSYLIQIIEGLKTLHDMKTLHRDLKSANVFLMKNGLLKLGDLNVSKVVKNKLVYTQTGTPYYASPEVWADRPYDYKSDIWSAGCVIYELCTLKPPFRGNSLEQLYQNVTKGVYDPLPAFYSSDLSKIIAFLLQKNPVNRPNCDMILSNPIILKRMDYNKNFGYGGNNQLLNTIKLPRNINEINQKLPKTKKYVEPTGLTTNFKPKNDDSKKITIQDGYQIYCPNSSETNRRVQIKSCEIDLNLKKEVVRPASAKIESRSRTPGRIINGIQRNELPQKVSPSRIIHPTNQTKHYIPSTNNIRLKSSPSTGSLANNKIVVPSTPQKNDSIGISSNQKTRANSARPISKIIPSNPPSSLVQKSILKNEKSVSPGRVLSAHPNNMNININVNNINIVNNVNTKIPSYEYKSPYKNNQIPLGQISRPSSSKDRNEKSYQPISSGLGLINKQQIKPNINPNYMNKISLDQKILMQPVKIIDSGPKRIPSANSNAVHNNFLRGGKAGDASGLLKIVHNNQPKLVNLYRK